MTSIGGNMAVDQIEYCGDCEHFAECKRQFEAKLFKGCLLNKIDDAISERHDENGGEPSRGYDLRRRGNKRTSAFPEGNRMLKATRLLLWQALSLGNPEDRVK